MKKRIIAFVLVACLAVSLLAMTAMAETEVSKKSGIYNLQTTTDAPEGTTLAAYTATETSPITGTSVYISATESVNNFYADAERVKISYTSSNALELVLVLNADATPTEGNIKYIDLKDGNKAVEFTLYPSTMASGHYYIKAIKDGALKTIAEFDYYAAYKLGDVNFDEKINATDALLCLQHSAKIVTLTDNHFLAGDVNFDEKINATDALKILQYSAKIITSFD